MKTLVWRGLDLPLMEVARVETQAGELTAVGTQLGVAYELRYRLARRRLRLELVGDRELDVGLDSCDFFDLGYSPLFNSLPVRRDGLLVDGPAREYVMRWVSVPELVASAGRKHLNALSIVAVLTKVVKEQQQTIASLSARTQILEKWMRR